MSLVLQKNRQTLWASVDVNVDQTVPLKTVLCFPKWPQMKHEVLGFDVDGTSSCLSGIIRKNDCELFILITFTKKQNKTKKDTDVCWILWCTQINTAAAFSGAIIFPGNCYGIRWYKAIVSIQERQTTILCFPQTTCKNTCSSPTVWTVCLVQMQISVLWKVRVSMQMCWLMQAALMGQCLFCRRWTWYLLLVNLPLKINQ